VTSRATEVAGPVTPQRFRSEKAAAARVAWISLFARAEAILRRRRKKDPMQLEETTTETPEVEELETEWWQPLACHCDAPSEE
jgi:hypothetical protein